MALPLPVVSCVEMYDLARAAVGDLHDALCAAAPLAATARCPSCDEMLILAGVHPASERWLALCPACEAWATVPPSGGRAVALNGVQG